MQKLISFLLVFLLLQSCKDESKNIDVLKQENERLKNELSQKSIKKTKFVWTLIHCKVGTYTSYSTDGKTGFSDLKNSLFWSDITEIIDYNDDMKYRLEDELENKCRTRYSSALHSIQERKTYVFNSYAEASEFKYKSLN